MQNTKRVVIGFVFFSILFSACARQTETLDPPPKTPAQPTQVTITVVPTTPPTPTPLSTSTPGASCVAPTAERVEAQVVAVIDGDTIDVNIDGDIFRVRYIGIDTPESFHANGETAAEANAKLVLSKQVVLIKDVSETDDYGRLLRYVFIEGLFVNLELVRQGFAEAGAWPPDTACFETFSAAEQQAQVSGLGFWSATPTLEAVSNTGSGCPQGCTTHVPGCDIKGNISYSSGEKIFHVPGQDNYTDTVINPEKGERWFCSEAEATANGWRKAKR